MIGTVFFKRLTNCFRSHRVIMFLLPPRIIKRLASDVINEGFRFNSSNILRPWQNSKADKPYSGIFKNYLDFVIKFIFYFTLIRNIPASDCQTEAGSHPMLFVRQLLICRPGAQNPKMFSAHQWVELKTDISSVL